MSKLTLADIRNDLSTTTSISVVLSFALEELSDSQDLLNVSFEITKKLNSILNKIARLEAKQEAEAQ